MAMVIIDTDFLDRNIRDIRCTECIVENIHRTMPIRSLHKPNLEAAEAEVGELKNASGSPTNTV